ncbi:MAG TPA: hypothetical protein DCR55_08075 [Lentisphaeria bacterium]|nr:hypothetical protein [Lentisphaeria bacterium]
MRVGFLCAEYPTVARRYGGIGTATQTLARALAATPHHDATVYVCGDREGQEFDRGVRVHLMRCEQPWPDMRRLQATLRQALAAGEVDLVESPECEAHCLPGGPGTVVRMNGGHHFSCATVRQRRRWRRLFLEQYGIRRAAGLCAVSHFAARTTREAMRLGRRTIDVLPNAIDTRCFRPKPESVQPGRIVFVGSLVEKKGIFDLLNVFPSVRAEFSAAQLLIVGAAPDAEARRRVEALAGEGVQILGPQPRERVAELMAGAQVCVFPSHMETQGIVLAEAQACGRPVIGTDAGPGPEVIGPDGQNGWLVPVADSATLARLICHALRSPQLCDEMGTRAHEWATDRFSLYARLGANLAFWEQHRRR